MSLKFNPIIFQPSDSIRSLPDLRRGPRNVQNRVDLSADFQLRYFQLRGKSAKLVPQIQIVPHPKCIPNANMIAPESLLSISPIPAEYLSNILHHSSPYASSLSI